MSEQRHKVEVSGNWMTLGVFLWLVWIWMAGCGGEFRVTTTQRGDTTTHTLSAGDE